MRFYRLFGLLLGLHTSVWAQSDVVLVHSYHADFAWVKEYRESFITTLRTRNVSDFFMDTKRIAESEFEAQAQRALDFIVQEHPKVVVLADDNALRFLGPPLLQRGYPVVFLGINQNPRDYLVLQPHLSGVLERPPLKRAVARLREFFAIERVLILTDDSESSHAVIETSLSNKSEQRISGVAVNTQSLSGYADWQQSILQAKQQGYQAIILGTYARLADEQGKMLDVDEVTRWSAQHSELPLFAFWRFSVAKDMAIGGLVISGVEQGQAAAEKTNRILDSGEADGISIPERGQLVFSQQALQRWQLPIPQSDIYQIQLID